MPFWAIRAKKVSRRWMSEESRGGLVQAVGMAEQRGRIIVNARGFGFLELEGQSGGSAFIAPPDLNPFLEGDLVVAHVDEADGRFTASHLRLLERTRTELFGNVVTHGRRLFLRTDRLVSNTDWPLDVAPDDPLLQAEAGSPVLLVAELRGDVVVPRRRVIETEADLERIAVRHGLRTEFSPASLDEAARAELPPLGANEQLGRIELALDG
jgi:ribonuclease R